MSRRAPLVTLLVLALMALCASAGATQPSAPTPASDPPGRTRVAVDLLVLSPGGLEVVRTTATSPAEARQRLRPFGADVRRVVAADEEVVLRPLAAPPATQWPLERLEAERAWTVTRGEGVVIGVLDSGVDPDHPDLRGALVPGIDLVGGSTDGFVDPHGHGTAVASVAAGRSDTGGVRGLASAASVMPLRVMDADGMATSGDAAQALLWAAGNGADVVNISLGGERSSSVLAAAVDEALDAGVTVVAAAGNQGAQGNPVVYPAALPGVIAVAATDRADAPAPFSNSGDWIDLAAPGTGVPTATAGGGWRERSGTSVAAPLVAASAALLRSQTPGLNPAAVRERLEGTATDVHVPGRDPQTGAGLVAPAAAVGAAAVPPVPQPVDPPADTEHPEPGPDDPPAAVTERIGTSTDVVRTAVQISRAAFPADGRAEHAVIGRHDVFADTLAGSALAGDRGPILYTRGGPGHPLHAETADELRRVLRPGATVFVLGGPQAVSPAAEEGIAALGFQVRRLAGDTRIETAIAVAAAVDPAPRRVLLARSDHWADAVTGGAYAARHGVPVLLTPRDALHPALAEALATLDPEVTVLGGPVAVAEPVARAAGAARRVEGPNRAGTAVAVAESLWGRTSGVAGDRFVAVEGYADASWAPALAAAPLSAVRGAPQLLLDRATATPPVETSAYLTRLGYGPARRGAASLVGPALTEDHARALASRLGG